MQMEGGVSPQAGIRAPPGPRTALSTQRGPGYDIFQFKIDRSTQVRGSLTIGKIINIMSVDVNRCDRILLPFSNISVSPILVSIAIWQIYVRMGNAIWGALGTTVFFLLMNIGQERVQEQVSTDRSVDGSRFEYFVGPPTDFGPWIPVWGEKITLEHKLNFQLGNMIMNLGTNINLEISLFILKCLVLILEIFLSVWKYHLTHIT